MIRANFVTHSTAPAEHRKIVAGLVHSMGVEYQIDPESKPKFFKRCLEMPDGIESFIAWAKDRHGLTLVHFGFKDKEGDWLACGYDLEEDAFLTKYMLTK